VLPSSRVILVALLVTLAAAVRLDRLGAVGFSEDEINKIRAVRAYQQHDFSANAEHPMLMKLADWASVGFAPPDVSPEAALRLPNAIVGSATTAVLFLLAQVLFDTTVGLWTAAIWALDINAAAINRIGKEDTFMLFFLLLAAYCYERAKAMAADPHRRDRWFNWSGASFGLMLASKYMPHYFGLHVLFNIAADRDPPDDIPDKRPAFFAAMAAAFAAANFAILVPAAWRYVLAYLHGNTLRHSGYLFAHQLYVNSIEATPWGVPPWFYVTFFATKVPLTILAAAIVGLVWVTRHPADRGATFVRVFLVFTLLPYSLVASKFVRYVLPMLAVIDIAAALGVVWAIRCIRKERATATARFAAAAVAAFVLSALAIQAVAWTPYYGLAQNIVGARIAAHGLLFPDDEFYDAGVREAVAEIAGVAGPDAVVCSDATAVVEEYLHRSGRFDMKACSIARDGLPMDRVETWVIAQDGHTYFENEAVFDQLKREFRPWRTVHVDGSVAVSIFHVRGVEGEGDHQ